MNAFDVILSTEAIAGILILGAVSMSVRSILHFTREAAGIVPKLQKVDMDLSKERDGMGAKRKTVKELTAVVDPLKQREARLRGYFEQLKNLELNYERSAARHAEELEEDKRRRIQRKKMGLG